jgi:hypothetical protein
MSDDKKKPVETSPARALAHLGMIMAVISVVVMVYVKYKFSEYYTLNGKEMAPLTVLCFKPWFLGVPPALAIFAYLVSFISPRGFGVNLNLVVVTCVFLTMVVFFFGMVMPIVHLMDEIKSLQQLIPGTGSGTPPAVPK